MRVERIVDDRYYSEVRTVSIVEVDDVGTALVSLIVFKIVRTSSYLDDVFHPNVLIIYTINVDIVTAMVEDHDFGTTIDFDDYGFVVDLDDGVDANGLVPVSKLHLAVHIKEGILLDNVLANPMFVVDQPP